MASPVPKFPEHRRNTSKPAHGEWVDLLVPKLSVAAHPSLAEMAKAATKNPTQRREWMRRFNKEDVQRWDVWRSDPVAPYWSDADVHYAIDTLLIYHPPVIGFAKEGDIVHGTPNYTEISRRLDRLALTPSGKRSQRFRICFAPNRDKTLDVGDEDEIAKGVTQLDDRRKKLQQGA